jgi:hypothetical protein
VRDTKLKFDDVVRVDLNLLLNTDLRILELAMPDTSDNYDDYDDDKFFDRMFGGYDDDDEDDRDDLDEDFEYDFGDDEDYFDEDLEDLM